MATARSVWPSGATRPTSGTGFDRCLHVSHRARAMWASPRQADANLVFEHDWDNLRAALGWAVMGENHDAAASLIDNSGPYAWPGHHREHFDWTTSVLMMQPDHAAPISMLGWAGLWRYHLGDHDGVIAAAERGSDKPSGSIIPTPRCAGRSSWDLILAGRDDEAHVPRQRSPQPLSETSIPLSGSSWSSC